MAALIVGTTFGPIIKHAKQQWPAPLADGDVDRARRWWPPRRIAVTLLAAPVAEWIGRAPEIAARIKEKLYVLDWPLAALRDLQNTLMPPAANTVKVEPSQISLLAPVVTAVTPAVAQVVIFAATLFFALVAQAGAAQAELAVREPRRQAPLSCGSPTTSSTISRPMSRR